MGIARTGPAADPIPVHAIRAKLTCASVLAVLGAACLAPDAAASQLIGRNGTHVKLEVNRAGRAMLTYRVDGRVRHVLAWGAVNARNPATARRQVAFKVDYSGGWGAFHQSVWKTFKNVCRPVSVRLAWVVAACDAPDGSTWAVQRWQRGLPNYGLAADALQASWELRLSHWIGPVPSFEVHFGWAYGRFQMIYGRFSYLDRPIYGFHSTPQGAPLDSYGRLVYVDTYDSLYGTGWHRENSFLTHKGTGGFCYGFYAHGERPSGQGQRYRATAIGPGALPDMYWEDTPPSQTYDRSLDLAADENMRSLLAGDGACRPH